MEDLARVVFAESPVGMALIGADFRFTRVNASFASMVGHAPSELEGRSFLDITHPHDAHDNALLARRLLDGLADRYHVEKRYLHADGHIVWVLANLSAIAPGAGGAREALLTVQELTESKRVEGELRALARKHEDSELRYRQILNAIEDLVFVKDSSSHLVWANRAFCDFFGFDSERVVGVIDSPTNPPENTRGYLAVDALVLATGATQHVEREKGMRRDGVERLLETVKSPLFDGVGTVSGLVGVARDVSERVALREELARKTAYFEALIEGALDLILVVDADGVKRFVSPSAERTLGWRPDELVGRTSLELVHPDDRAAAIEVFRRCAAAPGARASVEFRHLHRDGSWRHLEAVGHNLLDDPHVRGIIGSARDVTDRVRGESEREALIAELQAAIGEVKTLSGMLPICAACKRIRDDKGYWQQIEEYVRERTDADFSHGICPSCARRLYPDLIEDGDDEPGER